MKRSADLEAFAERLGHRFGKPGLLLRAVTHSSISGPDRPDNQRLEFLGDRVLGLVMASALFRADRDAPEGALAPRFNELVRRETCAEVALQIDLGSVIRLGRSETMSGGRRKQALLADAMEAVIGAIYLDAGFEKAERVVLALWGDRLHAVKEDARDAKTSLQEWAQARGQQPPNYVEVSRSGPDHAPCFTVEVRTDDGHSARAEARSKRQAEQAAARILLDSLRESQ